MVSPNQEFVHEAPATFSGPPMTVSVRPLDHRYLAYRLRVNPDESEQIQAQRRANQRERLPNLIGEFMIAGLHRGVGNRRIGNVFIDTIEAHRKELGLSEQVYAGYKAYNFVRHGVLFGEDNDKYAGEYYESNKFYAAQIGEWREQTGMAFNNPFYHMTRDEDQAKRGPVIVGYDLSKLQPGEILPPRITVEKRNELLEYEAAGLPLPGYIPGSRVPGVEATQPQRARMDSGVKYWEPVGDLKIEDAVTVVYHGFPNVSADGRIYD